MPTHPPNYAAYGATFSKDKELQDRHPITASSVALPTSIAIRLHDLSLNACRGATEQQLSNGGAAADLHAACRGGGHAPSHRVRGVSAAAHLRPSGPRQELGIHASPSRPAGLGVDRLRNRSFWLSGIGGGQPRAT